MVNAFNILYSASAVRRIFNLPSTVAVRIQKFAFVLWVHIAGQRPRFISFADFKAHFVDRRKAEAKKLTVTRDIHRSGLFLVRNESKGTTYQIQASNKRVVCGCDDFKNQAQFFGMACCKHAYSVLFHLGFTDLRDYLARS